MAHNIVPDQDDINIDIGRFIHENSYRRKKKELSIGNVKVDVLSKKNGYLMLGEIKKSSKYLKSAKMQLAYYLLKLKRHGLEGTGVLMIPRERKRIEVKLDRKLIRELESLENNILKICNASHPEVPKKINFCKKCGYNEFCWA